MSFFLNEVVNKTILISALDWGKGHLMRMSALIYQLKEKNNTLIFAGTKSQNAFIKREFLDLKTVDLLGYEIRLDSTKNTYLQLLGQYSQFLKTINKEKKWLNNFVKENDIDLIIADNRYGFYHKAVKSIIVTHQLTLQVPFFKRLASFWIQKRVANFNVCWIPDYPSQQFSGQLSNHSLKIPACFIGLLNRFEFVIPTNKITKTYTYLIILSGPDPERLNFAHYITQQLKNRKNEVALVGADMGGFESYQNVSSSELKELILKSEIVITRAGYTSIMELAGLKKEGWLYPTKGQYEQMYLAKHVKYDKFTFKSKKQI